MMLADRAAGSAADVGAPRERAIADHGICGVRVHVDHRREVEIEADGEHFASAFSCKARLVAGTERRWDEARTAVRAQAL